MNNEQQKLALATAVEEIALLRQRSGRFNAAMQGLDEAGFTGETYYAMALWAAASILADVPNQVWIDMRKALEAAGVMHAAGEKIH